MGPSTKKESFTNFIKSVVFKISTPIFLWSINQSSLEEYWNNIYEHEKRFRDSEAGEASMND